MSGLLIIIIITLGKVVNIYVNTDFTVVFWGLHDNTHITFRRLKKGSIPVSHNDYPWYSVIIEYWSVKNEDKYWKWVSVRERENQKCLLVERNYLNTSFQQLILATYFHFVIVTKRIWNHINIGQTYWSRSIPLSVHAILRISLQTPSRWCSLRTSSHIWMIK